MLSQVQNFHFFKNVADINFEETRFKKLKEEQIQKEEKRQVHSCAVTIQRYRRKRLSSLTKVKMEAKGDKMMISCGTLKAVDVTFVDVQLDKMM